MCGRYSITLPVEALRRMFAIEGGAPPNWPARYNVAPTQDVPLVRLAPGGAPFAFAALWEHRRGADGPLDSCALLTTDAPPSLAAIHHRVPVILSAEAWARWLDPQTPKPQLQALLVPPPDGLLSAHPVSTRVNAVANDGPELWDAATSAAPAPKQARTRRAAADDQGSLF